MSKQLSNPAVPLLSFVTDAEGDRVTIHADLPGLELLLRELTWLKGKLEAGECEHTHLRSPDWAGDELTTTKLSGQEAEVTMVHHVKIYGWNDEWKRKHGLVP